MQAMIASASGRDLGFDTAPNDAIPSPADTIPVEVIEFEDTAVLNRRISLGEDTTDAVILLSRPTTDSDWPPEPKPPTARRFRRAGVYKAITKVSSLIKIK